MWQLALSEAPTLEGMAPQCFIRKRQSRIGLLGHLQVKVHGGLLATALRHIVRYSVGFSGRLGLSGPCVQKKHTSPDNLLTVTFTSFITIPTASS